MTSDLYTRFTVKLGDKYVTQIDRTGLVLVQSELTMTSPITGHVSNAKVFFSADGALAYVNAYLGKKLPAGKRHSELTIAPIA